MLYEHKLFTTQQIVELSYPSVRAANHRLLDLFKWRVVDRFQPFVSPGTAPMHYVLDIAGALALAYEDGIDPKALGYRHEDAIGIAHSLRLAHTVGTNGFFTSLIALSRLPSTHGCLTAWWSELRCKRLFGDMVRPDAYGRWRETGHQIEFFLEFDFGTEDLATLASKLYGYEKLALATGITTPVLVWLPTSRRETSARKALAKVLSGLDWPALVPIATSTTETTSVVGDSTPAAARWLPVAESATRRHCRLRLVDLAQLWPYAEPPGTAAPTTLARQELALPDPLPPPPLPSQFQR